jgi:hypothetical protein
MTLLTIIQDACDEIGVAKPASVVGSSDQTAIQMLALANREGKELARKYEWTALQNIHSFNTSDGTASYALPSTGDTPLRIIEDTVWDNTNNTKIGGPAMPNEWATLQNGITSLSDLDSVFRVYGKLFYLFPTPTSTRAIKYDFIIENWCESSGGTDQAAWAADTDTGLLDEHLMTLGIIYRFKKAKGLPYEVDFNQYMAECSKAAARDGGRPLLNLSRGSISDVVLGGNVPDTGFG